MWFACILIIGLLLTSYFGYWAYQWICAVNDYGGLQKRNENKRIKRDIDDCK
jgi:hypothetical protein